MDEENSKQILQEGEGYISGKKDVKTGRITLGCSI
ncbi:hypothetical protein MSIBF_A1730002 [groundwater metagenome]|uniref:Uncharacterized protein n=1 Tax=groundwater metagenome TaxID=717931 RepID=A0A098E764_9ZZZZ